VEGGGFDEVVDGFGLGEVEAAREEGSLGEFAGFGEACAGGDALAEEVVEEDGGAVGGDFYDVFGGVGVGRGEEGDDGFIEYFASGIKYFGEAGLGGGQWVAELQERFGDGAGVGAGEAEDAYAASAGRGGDGYDGFFGVHAFCLGYRFCFARIFSGGVEMVKEACLEGFRDSCDGCLLVRTWWNVWWMWSGSKQLCGGRKVRQLLQVYFAHRMFAQRGIGVSC